MPKDGSKATRKGKARAIYDRATSPSPPSAASSSTTHLITSMKPDDVWQQLVSKNFVIPNAPASWTPKASTLTKNERKSRRKQRATPVSGERSSSSTVVAPSTYTPRPVNCALLFRSVVGESIMHYTFVDSAGKEGNLEFGVISKAAFHIWNGMDGEEKKEWKALAKKVDEKHKEDNPEYKFRPQRKQKGKGRAAKGLGRRGMGSDSVGGQEESLPSGSSEVLGSVTSGFDDERDAYTGQELFLPEGFTPYYDVMPGSREIGSGPRYQDLDLLSVVEDLPYSDYPESPSPQEAEPPYFTSAVNLDSSSNLQMAPQYQPYYQPYYQSMLGSDFRLHGDDGSLIDMSSVNVDSFLANLTMALPEGSEAQWSHQYPNQMGEPQP